MPQSVSIKEEKISSFTWEWADFSQLSKVQIYNILSLRQEIFIVEQECWYQDADGKDSSAHHLSLSYEKKLIGYLRLLKPGAAYPEPSIGRIVIRQEYRSLGLGKVLINEGKKKCQELYPGLGIKLSAQAHLQNLYESQGFTKTGEPYDEDGILHIEMVSK